MSFLLHWAIVAAALWLAASLIPGVVVRSVPALLIAALVLVGGTLLLTPGFLTDLVGFFFILPITRPLARGVLETVVTRKLLGGIVTVGRAGGPGRRPNPPSGPGDVIEGEIVDR